MLFIPVYNSFIRSFIQYLLEDEKVIAFFFCVVIT